MSELKIRILDMVKSDLAEIETALVENLKPNVELVSTIAGHILFSGGKRLRPLLMVLCAKICHYQGGYDKTFSIIFEYLHAATLLHDDVVDGALMRRGKPAAHSLWGGAAAVLTGDFLLARSLAIAAETGNIRIIRTISEITENMAQGEIHQLMRKGDIHLSEAEYLEVIRRKTAVLFQGACRVSALIADAPIGWETALADYGYHLGMAFQMADDLLDYTEDSLALGKTVGADLKEGKLTLPVIYALNAAGAKDRQRMETIICNTEFSVPEFQELAEYLTAHGGIDYPWQKANVHIESAKTAIARFEPSVPREILMDVADYALKRKS
jgi:octaprenyl-diphosphate synthase